MRRSTTPAGWPTAGPSTPSSQRRHPGRDVLQPQPGGRRPVRVRAGDRVVRVVPGRRGTRRRLRGDRRRPGVRGGATTGGSPYGTREQPGPRVGDKFGYAVAVSRSGNLVVGAVRRPERVHRRRRGVRRSTPTPGHHLRDREPGPGERGPVRRSRRHRRGRPVSRSSVPRSTTPAA